VTDLGDGSALLHLRHPSGREESHRFSARLIDQVKALNWCGTGSGYAKAQLTGVGAVYLHWLALGLKPQRGREFNVDHVNRDKGDSRDENLELKTLRGNRHNRAVVSEFGPCVNYYEGVYVVQVKYRGRYVHRPTFPTLQAASACRDAYLLIATEVDTGRRPVPVREELKAIADSIR
jgi:hypothetical protein